MLNEIEQIDKLEAENQMTDVVYSKRLTLKSDFSNIELKQSQLWA